MLAVDWSNRRRLLREVAISGDPTGEAEEAPQSPRGKRSLVRKSTAVLDRSVKTVAQSNLMENKRQAYSQQLTLQEIYIIYLTCFGP
jgi:hypothetical protein